MLGQFSSMSVRVAYLNGLLINVVIYYNFIISLDYSI